MVLFWSGLSMDRAYFVDYFHGTGTQCIMILYAFWADVFGLAFLSRQRWQDLYLCIICS